MRPFFLCLNILDIFILFYVDILANIGYNKDTVKGDQQGGKGNDKRRYENNNDKSMADS